MKIRIIKNDVEFTPENDLDVYNLSKLGFHTCSCLFSPEKKMINLTVHTDVLLEKLFEDKIKMYNS
jgi:predicted house-cleaning NTP pyrophosphatase (Maf/HAM1 superfamily)